MKTGYLCNPDTTASYCPFFLLIKGKTGANFLDTNLIQEAPECHDTRGLVYLYHGTVGKMRTFRSDKGVHQKKMLGIGIPELTCILHVELHHAIQLLGLLYQGTKATHSSRNRECDGSPSLLPRHAGWIDVVDARARSRLVVSGALHGLDGDKAEVPSMSRAIPDVGSKWPLQFSPMV
jgi:hypothetical protein